MAQPIQSTENTLSLAEQDRVIYALPPRLRKLHNYTQDEMLAFFKPCQTLPNGDFVFQSFADKVKVIRAERLAEAHKMFPKLAGNAKGVSPSLAVLSQNTGYSPANLAGTTVGFSPDAIPPETGYTPTVSSKMTMRQALGKGGTGDFTLHHIRHEPQHGFVKALPGANLILTQTVPKGSLVHLNPMRSTAAQLAGQLIAAGATGTYKYQGAGKTSKKH